MKKKENQIINQTETLDPSVERILNQDDEDLISFDKEDSFELSFESAMEP